MKAYQLLAEKETPNILEQNIHSLRDIYQCYTKQDIIEILKIHGIKGWLAQPDYINQLTQIFLFLSHKHASPTKHQINRHNIPIRPEIPALPVCVKKTPGTAP